MKKYLTPTGLAIIGTYELVPGTAAFADGLELNAQGFPMADYDGETKMDWDAQTTVRGHQDSPIYVDEKGSFWAWNKATNSFIPQSVATKFTGGRYLSVVDGLHLLLADEPMVAADLFAALCHLGVRCSSRKSMTSILWQHKNEFKRTGFFWSLKTK